MSIVELVIEPPERKPGLSEETLRSMLKEKRAYPHEVTSIVTELLELRARFNRRDDLAAPPIMADVFEQASVKVWHALTPKEKQECHKIIGLLSGAFIWHQVYPGERFWRRVSTVLEDLSS